MTIQIKGVILYIMINCYCYLVSDECPAGQYRSVDMDSCEECGENEMSAAGAASCTACGGGTVANEGHTACGKRQTE